MFWVAAAHILGSQADLPHEHRPAPKLAPRIPVAPLPQLTPAIPAIASREPACITWQGTTACYVLPVFSRVPSDADVGRIYPPQALEDEIEGGVTLRCQWTETGTVINCEVVQEAPQGKMFGAATVSLFEAALTVDARAMGPCAGKWFEARWLWRLD